MKLLTDEINQIYVWVDDDNEQMELSPHFDYEEDALQWKNRVSYQILKDVVRQNTTLFFHDLTGIWYVTHADTFIRYSLWST